MAYIYVHIYTYGHTYIKEKERNSTSSAPLVMHQPLGQSRAPGGNIFLYNTLPPEEFNKSETSGFLWFTFPSQSRQKPQKDPKHAWFSFEKRALPFIHDKKQKNSPSLSIYPPTFPANVGGQGEKLPFLQHRFSGPFFVFCLIRLWNFLNFYMHVLHK